MHRRTIALVPVAALALALATAPALAGKGGGSGGGAGSSISLVLFGTSSTLATAAPRYMDSATYSVSTNRTSRPWENTRCYQGSTLVLDDWRGMFDGYILSQTFTFGPTQLWTGGAASCVARLVSFDNGSEKTLATTSYDVAA